MGLMDSLMKAEEQARRAVQRSPQAAGDIWDDVERRLRRRWRILPRRFEARAPSSSSAEVDDMKKPA